MTEAMERKSERQDKAKGRLRPAARPPLASKVNPSSAPLRASSSLSPTSPRLVELSVAAKPTTVVVVPALTWSGKAAGLPELGLALALIAAARLAVTWLWPDL